MLLVFHYYQLRKYVSGRRAGAEIASNRILVAHVSLSKLQHTIVL